MWWHSPAPLLPAPPVSSCRVTRCTHIMQSTPSSLPTVRGGGGHPCSALTDNKTGRPAGTIYTSRRSVFPPYNSWSAASTTSAVDHKMGKSFYRKVSLPSRHVRLRIPFCKKHRQLWRRLSVTLQKANSAALAARMEGARPREDGRL